MRDTVEELRYLVLIWREKGRLFTAGLRLHMNAVSKRVTLVRLGISTRQLHEQSGTLQRDMDNISKRAAVAVWVGLTYERSEFGQV